MIDFFSAPIGAAVGGGFLYAPHVNQCDYIKIMRDNRLPAPARLTSGLRPPTVLAYRILQSAAEGGCDLTSMMSGHSQTRAVSTFPFGETDWGVAPNPCTCNYVTI